MVNANPSAAPSRLKALRLARGLSLERLAVLAGTTRTTLSLAERAPHLATDRTLRAVAQVLGVPVEDLRP